MKNRRERRKAQEAAQAAVNNVEKPVVKQVGKQTQEAEGSAIYASGGNKLVSPSITTTLIEQYADNALLAEPLKNIKDLVFTNYEDHPTPWVTVKDPEGNIDDDLSKQGQQIAKVCDFYPAHIVAYMDQELGGCSVWSPGWGTLDGVTGICPVELRNLPWNSFRDTPQGFTEVYNDIMPGIVIDPNTGQVRVFQKKDDRSTPAEIVQTYPLPSWLIVRDPTTPKPAGKPGCLPVVSLITKYNHADHAMDQKMNRVAAPSATPLADITKANKEFWEGFTKKWGKDTVFVLPKGTEFADMHLSENTTAEDRLASLKKRIDGFYNPATFLQKEGNTIGGSDSGAESMVNRRSVSTLSQLENGLGEKVLQIWLDTNGYEGYSVEVRYPRPETRNDTQTLAEIAEANKNGHISRMEARQKYPNLDLPELTPEEEAKMDAEYERRKPQQSLFGANPFGQPPDEKKPKEEAIGNVGSGDWCFKVHGNRKIKAGDTVSVTLEGIGNLTGTAIEDSDGSGLINVTNVTGTNTPPYLGIPSTISNLPVSTTEAELIAAHRQLKKDVLRIVKEKVDAQKPGILWSIKNVLAPVNNASEEGTWVTINGAHILIKDGESVGDAFKRTTGKDLGGHSFSKSGKTISTNAVATTRSDSRDADIVVSVNGKKTVIKASDVHPNKDSPTGYTMDVGGGDVARDFAPNTKQNINLSIDKETHDTLQSNIKAAIQARAYDESAKPLSKWSYEYGVDTGTLHIRPEGVDPIWHDTASKTRADIASLNIDQKAALGSELNKVSKQGVGGRYEVSDTDVNTALTSAKLYKSPATIARKAEIDSKISIAKSTGRDQIISAVLVEAKGNEDLPAIETYVKPDGTTYKKRVDYH